MSPALIVIVRYAAFYGAVFLALGVYLPYWPVWLGSRGLTSEHIGILLAMPSIFRIAGTPLIAQLIDRFGRPRLILALLAAGTAASFALLYFVWGFWLVLLASLPMALCFTALVPLSEGVTMAAVVRDGLDYGRIRLWGSVAFMVGTVGAGGLLTERNPDLILLLSLGSMLAAVVVAATLPRQPMAALADRRLNPMALLRNRRYLVFLGSASLVQASHAAYYAFSAVHWQAAGLSGTMIGALWAEGVIAEIIFFAVSAPILKRTSPAMLLLIAAAGGVIRWTVLGLTTDLAALFAVQILHAATFGAAHFGAMHFIARAAPPNLTVTAQGLYSAASGGIALGLALLLAGRLYGQHEGAAFLAMAGLSLGGAILAWILHRWYRGTIG